MLEDLKGMGIECDLVTEQLPVNNTYHRRRFWNWVKDRTRVVFWIIKEDPSQLRHWVFGSAKILALSF